MTRITILLASLLVSFPALAAELIDRTAVVINDDVILDSEIVEELDLYIRAEGIPPGEDREQYISEIRGVVVEGLIGRRLMDQAIVRIGIVVEDGEVDAAIANIADMNHMSMEQLTQQLAREGITLAEFRNDQRDYLMQGRLFQAEIGTQIEITEDMLRQRYAEQYGEQGKDHEYHLRVVILNLPERDPSKTVEEVYERAALIREQVTAGVPFEELAEEYCDDEAIASKGGDFGKVRPKAMIPEFRAAVEDLPLRAVSEPVEFGGALWMLQVYRITDAGTATFDGVRDKLFEELYQEVQEREIGLWLERERSRAHIEYLH